MSIPEIIHRCTACGASLKTALFCPQCGKPATPTTDAPPRGEAETEIEAAAEVEAAAAQVAATPDQSPSPVSTPATAAKVAREATNTERARASAGRELIERRVKPRVDKLRQATSVVLNEASYDPSVRFILVVAILFVLFLALMLLNKWLG